MFDGRYENRKKSKIYYLYKNVYKFFSFFIISDRVLLERFYLCMHKDVEETKKLIEVNYAIRNKAPHIFIDRDPTDEDSRKTFEYA